MLVAAIAALALGAVMTIGDFAWAALHIRHRVVYGVVHGAVVCLCIAIAIGVRAGKPARAAIAGPLIGVLAALAFYALVPALGWSALFPAWMLFWILFAMLQQHLTKDERRAAAAGRGVLAAILSGIAFYLVSDIWIHEARHTNLAVHFAAWSFAFLPGFLVLFRARNR
jgi:hypothetical protein